MRAYVSFALASGYFSIMGRTLRSAMDGLEHPGEIDSTNLEGNGRGETRWFRALMEEARGRRSPGCARVSTLGTWPRNWSRSWRGGGRTGLAYSKKRGLQAAIFHVRETNGISLAKSLSIRCVTLHSSTRNANLFAAQSPSRFGRSAQVDSHSVMGKVAYGGISTTLRIPSGRGVQRGG